MSSFVGQALLSLTVLASLGASAPYQPIESRNRPSHHQGAVKVGKAVYFLTNDAENAVVALPIGKDGMLSAGTITKTGGAGSIALNGDGVPTVPDALIGQSALTVEGNNIFAVNAGSNTLSMLTINPKDATCVTMVGEPVALPGEFPNTVAASKKNKLACVGMTGAVAGVSCASFSKKHGLGEMDAIRPFELGQSTPPKGPLNTVSHSFFSNDQSTLFTTVKGDPTVNNTGFLSSFKVDKTKGAMAMVSTEDMRSSPMGTAVLFGSAPIPKKKNELFVTDASFGAAVLSLDDMSVATVKAMQAIEGQAATCWATISKATKSAYVTDVAVNRMVEMSLEDASIIAQLDLSENGDAGLIDLRAAGDFVYALSPGNDTVKGAITVLDVSGGQGSMKQAQHFSLDGIAGNTAQGMAVL